MSDEQLVDKLLTDWPATEDERADMIAFGPAVFCNLKAAFTPPKAAMIGMPDSLLGVNYEVDGDIPKGEIHFKRWTGRGLDIVLSTFKVLKIEVA